MKIILGSLISLLCLTVPQEIMGQSKFLPSGLRVGTDIIKLGESAFVDDKTGFEFQADIDFHKFFLVADYGFSDTKEREELFNYANKGSYARIGLDYNTLFRSKEYNVLFFGARYAKSRFDDAVSFVVDDGVWGTQEVIYTNNNVDATWFEVVGGLKVAVWKQLFLGYIVRFKLGLDIKQTGTSESFTVPGFGRTDNNSNIGMNVYVYYRLAWRKKPIPPKKKA